MPKVLIYIVKKVMWVFLFYNTDQNENRAHVHVGKKGTQELCKIWLEPEVEVEKNGSLSDSQVKEVLELAQQYKARLLEQWKVFKRGESVRIIRITK